MRLSVLPALIFCLLFVVAIAGVESSTQPTLDREIAQAVEQAMASRQVPGAVILVWHQNQILHHQAYGYRSLVPQVEQMTTDTIFDMASITKPIVMATLVMQLVEQGKLSLHEKASKYLPSFKGHGKEDITLQQLMLHISGLIADNAQEDYEQGEKMAFEKIDGLKLIHQPGEKFVYSDVGYMVLGRIVEGIYKKPLEVIAQEQIFQPLNMKQTGYRRISKAHGSVQQYAPTEPEEGRMMRGVVHDPRGRVLDGVAGHAGLFSTSSDFLTFASMIMQGGGKLMKPETVQKLIRPHHLPGGKMRSLGWDMDTHYSAPRGEAFPLGLSFGHTGFTGPSIWIDPTSQTIVIIMTNRVHPDGQGNATVLRRTIANIVGRHIPRKPARSPVLAGIDVIRKENFKTLENKRVGLLTNHTGRGREGASTIDILHTAPKVKLVALFSPEHGIRGDVDAAVADGRDQKTGLPIYSLYGKQKKPTREQMQGLDALIVDLQDIGCRFYTYITTLGYVMEAAAESNVQVIVLDRPNPLGGEVVQGPINDGDKPSFVAWHPLPLRHGMTLGETAWLFNVERGISCNLLVFRMENWDREMAFDRTGLLWRNPSPNMRSLNAAWLYPGVGLLETTNLSVGRGTDKPFEMIGAPWIDGVRWAQELSRENVAGIRFVPCEFKPVSSVYANKTCQGVQIVMGMRDKVDSIQLGLALAVTLKRLYSPEWEWKKMATLLVNDELMKMLESGASVQDMLEQNKKNLEGFLKVRQKYLLYPKD